MAVLQLLARGNSNQNSADFSVLKGTLKFHVKDSRLLLAENIVELMLTGNGEIVT